MTPKEAQKLKVGDLVERLNNDNNNMCVGDRGTVEAIQYSGKSIDHVKIKGYGQGHCIENLKLIKTNSLTSKLMDLKEKFVLATTPEPHKSFRKTGITNGDNLLTDEGTQVFLGWLLNKYGAEFKTEVIDGMLKEDAKK